MMAEYKKGDWVRMTDNCHEGGYKAGDVFRLTGVTKSGVQFTDKDGDSRNADHDSNRFGPWRPKVGERVRVPAGANSVWAGDATVVANHANYGTYELKMLTGGMSGDSGDFRLFEIEPVTDPLPVAEQPAALTIKAGRYYKTRDGRKVGPMVPYTDNMGGWEYKWTNTPDPDRGRLWREDGTSGRGLPEHDLIAEWVDAPVRDITAATVDAINDEYGPVVREVPVAPQQARFKVGDRVTQPGWHKRDECTVVDVAPGFITVKDDNGVRGMYGHSAPFILVAPATPAIVCKIDNGQPLPATRPAVHATVESADAEAKRLASLHTGQEFGVFVLTGSSKVERTVEPGDKVIVSADLRVTSVSRGKANVVVNGGGSFTLPVSALSKAA